jgi:uncharacterized membrane protein
MINQFQDLSFKPIFRSAKEELTGKWGQMITVFIVIFLGLTLLGLLLGAIDFIAKTGGVASDDIRIIGVIIRIILFLCTVPITFGLCKLSLDLIRKHEIKFAAIFSGYKYYFKLLIVSILMPLAILVGLVLLIFPGFYLYYAYSQTLFILVDDPSLSPIEAMKKSRELMTSKKKKLLVIDLMLALLSIACLITLGIGYLWLMPFSYIVHAVFYERTLYINNNKSETEIVQ